jgi:hypothetical protein
VLIILVGVFDSITVEIGVGVGAEGVCWMIIIAELLDSLVAEIIKLYLEWILNLL